MKPLLILAIVFLTSGLLLADCAVTPNQWCQTYPGTASPSVPPYGRSWNNLVWNPLTHTAMEYLTDEGNIVTFVNSWYGFHSQWPNQATSKAAWTKYSSCGTSTLTKSPAGVAAFRLNNDVQLTDSQVVVKRQNIGVGAWPASGSIWIDDEELAYSSWSNDSVNNTSTFVISARGARTTSPASHTVASGAKLFEGCPTPKDGSGNPINDHPGDRHPNFTSTFGRGYLWQVGGYAETANLIDTWRWDAVNNWVRITNSMSPGRKDAAMAYDADQDVLVIYGGSRSGSGTAETRIFCFAVNSTIGCSSANQWIKLTAANLIGSPPATFREQMVYDSTNKQVLIFGGYGPSAQVWALSFDAAAGKWRWTQMASMPYAMQWPPVAFDSHLGVSVLYTWPINNGTQVGETWTFDAATNTWAKSGVNGGPVLNTNTSQHLVFDPDSNVLIFDYQATATAVRVYELPDSALVTASRALSVSLTAPQPGSTVSGDIAVSATISDNTGTPQVQFILDGAPLGPQVTSAPYTTLWNTRNAANGPHALAAILTDPAGNRSASTPVSVTVSNGALSVSLTAPQPGSTVSGNITVSATAFDNTGTPQVQFILDGAPLGSQVTSAPYSTLWNTQNEANGPHALAAILTDPAGNRSASTPVSVTVSNGALSISITTPQPDSTVSGNIAVSATAFDNTGTARVQFTLDGAPLGPQVTSAPYTILWNTRNVANGRHALAAILTDPARSRSASTPVSVNRSVSTPVSVTVSNGALSVSLTAPQPGSTVSGNITVSATAFDNTGTPQVQFILDGAPLGPQVTSAPYTTLWNTRNAASGPHALAAILTDPAGNRNASTPVSVTVGNAIVPPPPQGVFRDWGSNYVYIHPQLTTTSGNVILAASQVPPPVPVISGVVRVDGAFFDGGYLTAAPPAPGSITIEYMVDGNRSGTYVTGPPLQWDWNSATVPDGTHVLSIRIVDSTGATYPADQLRTEAQTVVVQNVGPVNGAQRVPVPGFYFHSNHEPSAIDWVNYSGTPQHNNVHPYPYQFISPSSATALRDPRNWFIEPLTETRHSLYTSSPQFYTTQSGGVVVQGYVPEAATTIEGAYSRVEHHYNLDGGRDDNMVDPYSTLVPAPDGTGWVGIDIAGRLFKIGFDGSVTTLAGFNHRRDVLQYDYRDLTVTDEQWRAKATQIGNDSFEAPVDLTFDPRNPRILYVADTLAHRIAKVDLSVSPPVISTYAGVKDTLGYQDGPSSTAKFNEPYSLIMASDGTMYVADFMNSAIRKISPDGSTVGTLVGGRPVPSARIVAANRDAYSSSAPMGFASAMIPYPQVIRFDSSGNIVLGEMVTRLIRLINLQTHVVSRIQAITSTLGVSADHSWIWLDVDTLGTIGPVDDIIVAHAVGAPGNVNLWRISHDGSAVVNIGGDGWPVQDGKANTYVNDRAGHYPWIIAISKTEGRFITTGFGSVGLSSWRIVQATDPPMNLDFGTFVRGYKIWKTGTAPGFPWGSRPAFSSLGGERGVSHLGIIPSFDDLMNLYPTDAALATYIQNGMGGSVPRPEITGNDVRALIYFVRLSSLQGGSLSPVSPGLTSMDSTPPVISTVAAVRLDATTARVTWTTSKPCLGFVPWGSTSNYNGWSDIESGYSTTHSLVVSGLPRTLIHFAVVAKDLAGNQSFTTDTTF